MYQSNFVAVQFFSHFRVVYVTRSIYAPDVTYCVHRYLGQRAGGGAGSAS